MAEKRTIDLKRFQERLHKMAVTADDFQKVWEQFDEDSNGYIEGKEIETFLRTLLKGDGGGQDETISDGLLADLTKEIMEKYDANLDNKIEMSELAEMLQPEENFLLLFRSTAGLNSSIEFMETWRKYDTDKSGYIESQELSKFLEDALKKCGKEITPDKLQEYTQTMLSLYDSNNDGKLELKEMAKLLPVKENFLKRFEGPLMPSKDGHKTLSKADFERVFNHYDRDGNGMIEGDELKGFLKDLMEHEDDAKSKKYSDEDLEEMCQILMKHLDLDGDGTLDLVELKMLFCPLG
ncbi:calretinin-like isoform X3 [Anneissia japonica]|uniref:calretinin-like isoform X3 n=1 Tax=Anneissia japonica TaxID=1529436 RepID=UPI0014256A54|nr:calretinin-like isoform X3 [Anneissia japonica]